MTPFDDHPTDMDILPGTPALSDSDVEALLSGRAVLGFDDVHSTVRMLRAAAPPPAPVPSSALLAVMEAGFDPLPLVDAAEPRRRRRWAARLTVATAAVVATTLGAAAANALPAPVQNAVAFAVGALTPLDLPRRGPELAFDEPDAPLGDRSGSQTDPGSEPPAGATLPGDDPRPDDLAPAIPGRAGEPPPAQPAPTAPAATRDARRATEPDDVEADSPELDEPDSEERDVDEPDTDEPDTDEPDLDADEPDADADQPNTDEPDVDEPDTDEPDVDEPDVDEPDTEDAEGVED